MVTKGVSQFLDSLAEKMNKRTAGVARGVTARERNQLGRGGFTVTATNNVDLSALGIELLDAKN